MRAKWRSLHVVIGPLVYLIWDSWLLILTDAVLQLQNLGHFAHESVRSRSSMPSLPAAKFTVCTGLGGILLSSYILLMTSR